MKRNLWIVYWVLASLIIFTAVILSGCGGEGVYSPFQPPSSETETGKTAKVLLRINFGEERARGDQLPLIKEAQRKKVSKVYGWFYGQKDYYFACEDNGDECIIEKEIEPGQYYLWVAAEQELGDGVNPRVTFSFYEKNLEFREGTNEKTVLLKLEDWQPISIVIPDGISAEVEEYGCFSARGRDNDNSFYSCFELLSASSLIGALPLDATEINLRLNDKIYQIEPQKFLDALIFDEPVSLADCQWKLATIAVMNVDIGGPNMVVAGAHDVLALKFKVEAANDFPLNNICIKMKGLEYDIDWVELILHDDQGDIILGEDLANDRIAFNISPVLEITAQTSKTFSVFVDIPLSAGNGNTFSFSVESINGDPNFAFKEIGPEFTIVRIGTLSVKNDWSPCSSIVLAGSAGNNFLDIEFSAEGEEFKIKSLTFQVIDGGYCGDVVGEYKDVWSVAIYDGTAKLAEGSIPSTSGRTFYFNTPTTPSLIIPKERIRNKVLIVKSDMSTIDPEFDNAPGSASADVKIVLTEVEAVGTTSNFLFYFANPVVESSPMILRTSRPIVEYSTPWDSMGAATILANGNLNLFNFKITADASGGEVLQNKVSLRFQMSDGVQISDIRILDQNGYVLNYGSPDCKGDCSAGLSLNNPDFDAEGDESIKIPSGQSRTFFVWGIVSGVTKDSIISITLLGDSACSPVDTATEVASQNNFVWSDNYRQTSLIDAPNHPQWYNGHLVPGLKNQTPYIISY